MVMHDIFLVTLVAMHHTFCGEQPLSIPLRSTSATEHGGRTQEGSKRAVTKAENGIGLSDSLDRWRHSVQCWKIPRYRNERHRQHDDNHC